MESLWGGYGESLVSYMSPYHKIRASTWQSIESGHKYRTYMFCGSFYHSLRYVQYLISKVLLRYFQEGPYL